MTYNPDTRNNIQTVLKGQNYDLSHFTTQVLDEFANYLDTTFHKNFVTVDVYNPLLDKVEKFLNDPEVFIKTVSAILGKPLTMTTLTKAEQARLDILDKEYDELVKPYANATGSNKTLYIDMLKAAGIPPLKPSERYVGYKTGKILRDKGMIDLMASRKKEAIDSSIKLANDYPGLFGKSIFYKIKYKIKYNTYRVGYASAMESCIKTWT